MDIQSLDTRVIKILVHADKRATLAQLPVGSMSIESIVAAGGFGPSSNTVKNNLRQLGDYFSFDSRNSVTLTREGKLLQYSARYLIAQDSILAKRYGRESFLSLLQDEPYMQEFARVMNCIFDFGIYQFVELRNHPLYRDKSLKDRLMRMKSLGLIDYDTSRKYIPYDGSVTPKAPGRNFYALLTRVCKALQVSGNDRQAVRRFVDSKWRRHSHIVES
jgi:hypothetical protein